MSITQVRFLARTVEGAVPLAAMPGFVQPQLATLKAKPPAGERWIHEIKFDGYRAEVHIDRGRVRIFTRKGVDLTCPKLRCAGYLALQLRFLRASESMGNHDSKIVDAGSVD
jgi:bifunctional non-homologous end joining protein LigD